MQVTRVAEFIVHLSHYAIMDLERILIFHASLSMFTYAKGLSEVANGLTKNVTRHALNHSLHTGKAEFIVSIVFSVIKALFLPI